MTTRIEMLLSPGDKQNLVQSLWFTWNEGGAALERFPKMIETILDTEAWHDREANGKPMHNDTFREFIVSPPLKGCGWEKHIDAIENLLGLKAPDILRRWREAMTPPVGVHHDSSNITITRGTTLAYTLDRLSRKHPKLYQRVIAGELSANAAAIEAGFRKRPRPLEQIRRLIPKLTAQERRLVARDLGF
jgi:hypothetical protein